MDIRLLYNVVLPTLARAGIAFIGISTLADPFNFWTQMLELKDEDGRQVFKTLRYTLVCDDCARAGKEDTCKHKMGDLPYWQDASQHKKLEAIMQDKHDSFIRETKGGSGDPNIKPAFQSKVVKRWMDQKHIDKLPSGTPVVFTSVDPAAGGRMSDYAIISFIVTPEGHYIIVGAEAFAYRTALPQSELLISHIKAVRNLPGLESAHVMLSVESNLGNEAMHHQAYVASSGLTKVIVMNEDQERAGVRTTNDMKRTMVIITNDALTHLRLHFYKDMVSINGKHDTKKMMDMITKQVISFHRIVEPPLKVHQQPKEIYNGKMGGGKDDLLMALMLGLYMYGVAASKPEKYGPVMKTLAR